jgi:hydroxymethylpyrimidine/phosphomethylpyrimidine kinase
MEIKEAGVNVMIARALTIAGSDSSGGAGIQADLKTFTLRHVYGMSAIAAVTVQNTLGVYGIYDLPVEAVGRQIDAVAEDIGVDALKTGMLSKPEVIEVVVERLLHYGLNNIVVDPVMVAKGGASLLAQEAVETLKEKLLPIADIITPNLPEAEVLLGEPIQSLAEMERAAKQIVKSFGVKAVVIKGGHLSGEDATDVLFDGMDLTHLPARRFQTRHTHGTGCTFSAAIAAELAKGKTLKEAVHVAKMFIDAAISHPLNLGHGHGPTNHWAYRQTPDV